MSISRGLRPLDPWDKKTGVAAILKRIESRVRSNKWKELLRRKERKK